MATTYTVWRWQCDPVHNGTPVADPMVERFGQKFVNGIPDGGTLDLQLKPRPRSSFATLADLEVIDPASDILLGA